MQTGLYFMGHDFILDIDWTLTHPGTKPQLYGPPEDCYEGDDPEWEVNSIHLKLDDPDKPDAPLFKATGALLELLATHRAVDDAILEYINEWGEDEDTYPDEDYYRDR
jgi:hypothetical protein